MSKSGKYASIELSLKADGIQIFPLANREGVNSIKSTKLRKLEKDLN